MRRIGERAKARRASGSSAATGTIARWTPGDAADPRADRRRHQRRRRCSSCAYDGRTALANSAALGRAGVTERTPDPPGGAIVRDANGFPTGVLTGAAMAIVARVIPTMTPEQRLQAVKRALELAASLGVTSVQDMNASAEDVSVYADLANRAS